MKSAQERNSSKPRLSKVVQAGGSQGGIVALFAGDLRNSVISGGYHAQEGISTKTLVPLGVKLLSRRRFMKGSGVSPREVRSAASVGFHRHGDALRGNLEPLPRTGIQAPRKPTAMCWGREPVRESVSTDTKLGVESRPLSISNGRVTFYGRRVESSLHQ